MLGTVDRGGHRAAYTYTCSGTTTTVLASRAVIGANLPLTGLASLTTGATDHLRVTQTLPAAAPNTMQGLTSTISYNLSAPSVSPDPSRSPEMPTLMIPAEQPWQGGAVEPRERGAAQPCQGGNRPRRSRADAPTVRAGVWVWGQRVLLALALILFLALGVLPRLGLYRPVTVLSGSMRPTFSPGDMVVVVPEPVSAVRVGQVISYQVPVGIHQVETHRIVKILQGGAHPTVQTQGDANNYHDPWTAKLEGNTAWRMVAVIRISATWSTSCAAPCCRRPRSSSRPRCWRC